MVYIEKLYALGTEESFFFFTKPSFKEKTDLSLAFGQTQFGVGQTKMTQLIYCAQLPLSIFIFTSNGLLGVFTLCSTNGFPR